MTPPAGFARLPAMKKLNEADYRSRRARYARRWHVPATWESASLSLPPYPAEVGSRKNAEWRNLAQIRRRILARKEACA